jgi:hypothetical protein
MEQRPLPKELKASAVAYAKSHEAAREAANLDNRTKTELRNAVKAYWSEEALPVGSFIRASGLEFRYEATKSTVIDPDKVLELYEKKIITREQFLRMVSIAKGEAKNVLGGDQVAAFEIEEVGDKIDIRVETLAVENANDEFVAVQEVVKTKTTKRVVFGGHKLQKEVAAVKTVTGPKLKRVIKVGKR